MPAAAESDRDETPLPAEERFFPVRGRRLALEALLPAVVSWVWAVFNYRLWDLSWRVPIHSMGDARLITNLVKNTADQGWWTTNPDLGYPFDQQLYDFPHGGETWQLVIVRFLTLFTKSPGLVMNIYFFVGIGVAALAAYLALRHLRFSVGLSLVVGTALTWLPFRLGHGQWHLFRTSFWWVPLAVVMILWTIHWRERFLRDPDPGPRDGWRDTLRWTVRHNLRVRRVATFAVMILVLGMSETMTTAFTLTLLALTGILGALRRREPVTLVVHGVAIVAIALVFFVGMASSLRFFASNGVNPAAGKREVIEQENFGLKMSEMLLPDPSHRGPFGDPIREVRPNSLIPGEGGQNIGLLGAAGFIGAVIHALFHSWGSRRRDARPLHDRASLRDDVSVIAVVGFLVATVSGAAIFLSLLGLTQIRVWNRMSLIIGLCSMIYTMTWFEAGWARLRTRLATTAIGDRRWARPLVGTALVAALVGFVIWDGAQVGFRPASVEAGGLNYAVNDRTWEGDAAYAAAIDEALPDGSAVFQFPIMQFPEVVPPLEMTDYDHLRGWVHLPPGKIQWSYGAVKGRQAGEWQVVVQQELGEVAALPYLIGLGFDGVWVDTFGYTLEFSATIRSEYEDLMGDPLVSDDGRTLFWDLRPLAEDLADEGQDIDELERMAEQRLGVPPGD